MKNKLVCVVGANASGKSNLGVELGVNFSGEVVSADSRQIYRNLDLGSGKMTASEMRGVPHHLIDIVVPGKIYPLFQYQRDAYAALNQIIHAGKTPFLVGGTGLYINAITEGYVMADRLPNETLRGRLNGLTATELAAELRTLDPEAFTTIDTANPRRLIRAIENALDGRPYSAMRAKEPRYECLKIGIFWDRDDLRTRIKARLDARIKAGMVEEVEGLINSGVPKDFLLDIGLEYRFITMFLGGNFTSKSEFTDKLYFAICQFAKKQYTWFRKDTAIKWQPGREIVSGDIFSMVERFILSR